MDLNEEEYFVHGVKSKDVKAGHRLRGATGRFGNVAAKETEYEFVRFEDGDETAVVRDVDTGRLEAYAKSPGFAGFHLIINGIDYEFAHEVKESFGETKTKKHNMKNLKMYELFGSVNESRGVYDAISLYGKAVNLLNLEGLRRMMGGAYHIFSPELRQAIADLRDKTIEVAVQLEREKQTRIEQQHGKAHLATYRKSVAKDPDLVKAAPELWLSESGSMDLIDLINAHFDKAENAATRATKGLDPSYEKGEKDEPNRNFLRAWNEAFDGYFHKKFPHVKKKNLYDFFNSAMPQ